MDKPAIHEKIPTDSRDEYDSSNSVWCIFILSVPEMMKRHLNLTGKKVSSNLSDRLCLSFIASLSKRVISHLTIFKPETLLEWQWRFIKNTWSYNHKKRGRKPVSAELKKLNINIHHTTVNKIIQTFRKQGKKTLIYDNALQFTSIGIIKKEQISGGLHHNYYRSST